MGNVEDRRKTRTRFRRRGDSIVVDRQFDLVLFDQRDVVILSHPDCSAAASRPRSSARTLSPMARRHLIDVHVLLVRDHGILLCQRRDSNPQFDEQWHLPSGKLEDESVLDAAVREAGEEVGVLIKAADLRCVHTIHVNGSGPEPRLGLFFVTNRWIGEPSNREPEKCAAIRWFGLDNLPQQLIPYTAAGIRGYCNGISFSVLGWTDQRLRASA
jgi:8-oxo-dGTP diphosphatase